MARRSSVNAIWLRNLALATALAVATSCGGKPQTAGREAVAATAYLTRDIQSLRAGSPAERAPVRGADMFAQVFELVKAEYVHEVDAAALLAAASEGMRKGVPEPAQAKDDELVVAAVSSMLESLDPYSAYLDRDARQAMRDSTRGEFGGLGIQVQTREGFVEVVSPIDDTPAQRAGLKPGDRITHVDRVSLAEVNLRDAVSRLRGPIGSRVILTVARNGGSVFDVTLVRELIRTPAVRWHLEDDVGYLRITSFISEHTHEEVAEAVAAIRAKLGRRLRGLAIDLRNNPGGLFDEGVTVADDFLDSGLIVSTLGRTQERHYKARKGELVPGVPIAILVNKGSASAAEIFAGALRDNGRARLIGTQTFGKGSVQTIISLSQEDAVKLTTAHYHTPSGLSVEGGIAPDIVVEADEARPGDEELQRALAELRARRR